MNNRIEEGLRRAVHQLPSTSFDAIADIPVVKMPEHDDITRQEDSSPRGRVLVWPRLAGLAACAAAFVVVFSGWYVQNRMVDSTIDLDVNPGFEITLNRKEKVLDVQGLNREAQDILEGRVYRGWELDDTVDTLFGDLAERGYIDSSGGAVLVSVEGGKAADARQLQELVSDRIALSLIDTDIRPRILLQELHGEKEIKLSAEALGITQGKMQLIQTLADQDGALDTAELAGYRIDELKALADDRGLVLYVEEKTYPIHEEPEEAPDAEPERSEPEAPSSQAEPVTQPAPPSQPPVQPPSSSAPAASQASQQQARTSQPQPPQSGDSGYGSSDYGSSLRDDGGDSRYGGPNDGGSGFVDNGGDSGYYSSYSDSGDSGYGSGDYNDYDLGDSGYDDDYDDYDYDDDDD